MKFNIFTSNAKELEEFIRETPELKRRIYRDIAKEHIKSRYNVISCGDNTITDNDIDDYIYRYYDLVKAEADQVIKGLCKRTMSYNWCATLGAVAVFAFCFFPALRILYYSFFVAQPPPGIPSTAEIALAALPIVLLFFASLVAFFMLGRRKE